MVEIYWLQRLGNIGFCFNVGFWVCIAIAYAILLWCLFEDFNPFRDKRFIHRLKKFVMVFAFFTAGAIIVPTQHDLMAIYGLGGTIDYIKSNDKAKELPDKVVDALTRYVDSIEKENGEENNTNQ
jgi:low temperature requirement protein LtrA